MTERQFRGAVLVVDEIIGYDWFRTRIRARVEFFGGDNSRGYFSTIEPGTRSRWHKPWQPNEIVIRADGEEPVFLVCRGKHWRVDDAIPVDDIVYRYER